MSSEKNPAASPAPFVEAFHYPQAAVPGSRESYVPAPGGETFLSADRGTGEQLASRLNQAREEGIREGEQRGGNRLEQEVAQQRAKIAEALSAFERERAEYYAKIEAEVVHLAVAIAAKILHREAQVDRMLLAALVKVALEKLQQNTRVLVRVPPRAGCAVARVLCAEHADRGQPRDRRRRIRRVGELHPRNRAGIDRTRPGIAIEGSRDRPVRSAGPTARSAMKQGSLATYLHWLEGCSTLRWKGRITQVIGNLVEAAGPFCSVGECCEITNSNGSTMQGEIVGFRDSTVLAMPLERPQGVRLGDEIATWGAAPSLRVGPELLGRVIDATGNPLDSLGDYRARMKLALQGNAPCRSSESRSRKRWLAAYAPWMGS